ncbi:MAG: glycosyltransferase family 2 protein, partial [Chloroflexales bacterium]|nr:glycosyltransferase family 2 protein [Chloroflexales bacterium]
RRTFPVVSPPPPAELLPDPPRGAAADEQPGLLSVVTTFYNLGAYIEETLESVLAATYAPREVVIVDDGSTDPASLEAHDRIRRRELPDVRIVRTTNQGLASARNNGADAARGEFIAFVDADDAVEPAFFSRAVDTLQRYDNVAFIYSWVRYFGESGAIWPTWSAELPYMLGHNMLTPLTVVRRAWYQRAGRNRPAFEYNFEDYESWLAIVLAGGLGVSLPQPLVRYRVRPGSLWRQGGQNQFLFLYDLLAQHHPAAYAHWSDELFHLQNANGPGLQWEHPGTHPSSLHHEYVVQLEQLRDKLWTDNQFLGKAWNDHVAYIEGQRQHITQLEGILNSGNGWLSGAELRAIRASGRLVRRVRRTWIAQQVLRNASFKHAIKKMLKI